MDFKEDTMKFQVKPPSGVSPRGDDTPRTRNLKELRLKRLQYFESRVNNPDLVSQDSSDKSRSSEIERSDSRPSSGQRSTLSEDVRASMIQDSRILSVDSSSNKTVNNVGPNSPASGDNTFHHPARRTMHLLGSERNANIPSDFVDHTSGYRIGENAVNFHNSQEVRQSFHFTGNVLGTDNILLQKNLTSGTSSQSRPDNFTSLGFTLPDLSPRNSNIITPKQSIPAKKSAKIGPGKSPGKQKGKKPRHLVSSSRETFTSSPASREGGETFQVAGTSISLESERQGLKLRKSVIDADFEDDYSELGLSMDRGSYGQYRGPIPIFNPSGPTKSRKQLASANPRGVMKTSSSMGNFRSVSESPSCDDPTLVEEDSFQASMAMSKSASCQGFNTCDNDSFNNNIPSRNQAHFDHQDSEMNDSLKRSGSPTYHRLNVTESSERDSKPSIPKLMFQQPLERESADFEDTKRSVKGGNGKEAATSTLYNEFASPNLQSILGKDRLDRLLKNLEESAWIEMESDKSSGAGSNVFPRQQDISVESYRSESETNAPTSNPEEQTSKSQNLKELGLTTHRPPDLISSDKNPSSSSQVANGNLDSAPSTGRRSAKYSFSSEEIYAQAKHISLSKADPASGNASIINAAEKTATSNARDALKNTAYGYATLAEKSDEVSKFDYVRGIHSVKKEFYKTVTVTDSTAVSDASASTAKLSRLSVESANTKGLQRPGSGSMRQRKESGGESRHSGNAKESQEEHIEGIRQHVADIRIQQFEDQIKAGAPYTTSSIERYFASMERLNRDPEKGFEPVPEPEIAETPRGNNLPQKNKAEKMTASLKVDLPKPPDRFDDVKHQRDHLKSKSNSSASHMKDSNVTKRQLQEDSEHSRNIDLKNWSKSSLEEGSLSQREKWEQFKLDNDKRKILNEFFGSEASDDDDLFTKVTSLVTDMDESATARLKTLGIDFSFLKNKDDEKNAFTEKDAEVSSHSSHCELDKDMNRDNMYPDSSKGKLELEDEVEVLFTMSSGGKGFQKPSGGATGLVSKTISTPAPSGEPSLSQSAGAAFHRKIDDVLGISTASTSSGVSTQVKVCPECAEVNKTYVTWCVECGAVLGDVDPVPFKPKRDASRHLGNQSSNGLSQSATNFKNRLEESMNNPDGFLAATYQEEVDKSVEQKKSGLMKKRDNAVRENRALRELKAERGVRDSDEFEYDTGEIPVRSLPKALQSELSLDLEVEPKKGRNHKGQKKNNVGEDIAKLSEDIVFEYRRGESPKKSLPVDLQEELNLNLDGSQTTASLQGFAARNNNSSNQKAAGRQSAAGRGGEDNNLEIPVQGEVKEEGHKVDKGLDPMQDDTEEEVSEQELDIPGNNSDEDGDDNDDDRIVYKEFIQRLRTDPRLKSDSSDRPQSAMPVPSVSGGPPKNTVGKRRRPQSAKCAMSKVRASIEAPGYQRKWERSSTMAWGSLSHGEIRPRSSVHVSAEGDRPASVMSRGRPSSSLRRFSSRTPGPGDVKHTAKKSAGRPQSAGPRRGDRGAGSSWQSNSGSMKSMSPNSKKEDLNKNTPDPLCVQSASYTTGSTSKSMRSTALKTYAKYFEMSPRIAAGEFSPWLCLPDEIWLYIFGFLRQRDLARCAQVCMQLHRVALDESLWRSIVIKKNYRMCDEWLAEVGRRLPAKLSFIQCTGEKVTANGLRELFRQCADSLVELNFTGCTRGELTGDNIMLHAASRCRNVASLDTSWCNVNDNGVMAMSESCSSLESVSLNGCQMITDDAIVALITKHGIHLKTLELFGCFNVTHRTIGSVSAHCKNLVTLNLGQCWKLTDTCITQLSPSLANVVNLDLRGCKQMRDMSVHQVIKHGQKLKNLSLANCPNLTNVSLTEIGTYGNQIESLDLCGCKGITDMGVRALAMACQQLQYLDVSSTAVTHKSVSTLASYCHENLEVLKLNFCKHITVPSLVRLAKNCKRLCQLYVFGVDGLRRLELVHKANPDIWIQM